MSSVNIPQGWAAFGKLCSVFKVDIPLCLKRNAFELSIIWGKKTTNATQQTTTAWKLQIPLRAMERTILGKTFRDKMLNVEIGGKTGLKYL